MSHSVFKSVASRLHESSSLLILSGWQAVTVSGQTGIGFLAYLQLTCDWSEDGTFKDHQGCSVQCYIPLGICSPLRKEEHIFLSPWRSHVLLVSDYEVPAALIYSLKWLWLCWRWWDLHHLPALWTQIVSIKALNSGNVFSCAPFLPSLQDEQHSMASHHICKLKSADTKR